MPATSTVRSRLFWLVVAVILPGAAAAFAAIHYVHSDKQRQFEAGLAEATRALSLVVDREIARREAVMRTLAASPTLDGPDLRAFYDYAKTIAPTPETAVVLATPDGRQVVNTRRDFGDRSLPSLALSPEQLARAQRSTVITDLYYAPIGRQYSFAVDVPVVRNGRTLYLLSYGGYASALQKVFTDQRLPAGWMASILDDKGQVVARNLDPEAFVGKYASQTMRSQLAARDSGVLDMVSLDGTPTLAAFSKAPSYGWTVIVGVPMEQVGSPTAVARNFAIAAALLLALALYAAARLGRGLVGPVLQVKRAAERIARAEPADVQPTGLAEMDTVLRVLADTGEAVRTANADMQRRVQEAVAEADKAHQAVLQNQRLEALGQLTGGVAHDFNNLLMVVSNYAHLLRARHPQLGGSQELAGVERAVETGSRLTRQLLAFARRQPVRPERISLQARLPELATLLAASLGSRVRLRCDVDPDVRAVEVDPSEFELAIINLAVNARDAMPDGGTLQVRARNEGADRVAIEVADNGRGIEPELLEKVFEPFFTTKPVGQGTGLGLSQVYGFAQQAGGDARITSTVGEGTSVTLLLPGHEQPASAGEQEPAVQAPAYAGGDALLLVEDNGDLAQVTREVLQAAGFRVTHAADGAVAMAMIKAGQRFRAVLSDIRMPGVNGIELAGWLRKAHPDIPIVLMTGYSEELARASELGLQVLPKPSPPSVLLEALQRELRAGRDERRGVTA